MMSDKHHLCLISTDDTDPMHTGLNQSHSQRDISQTSPSALKQTASRLVCDVCGVSTISADILQLHCRNANHVHRNSIIQRIQNDLTETNEDDDCGKLRSKCGQLLTQPIWKRILAITRRQNLSCSRLVMCGLTGRKRNVLMIDATLKIANNKLYRESAMTFEDAMDSVACLALNNLPIHPFDLSPYTIQQWDTLSNANKTCLPRVLDKIKIGDGIESSLRESLVVIVTALKQIGDSLAGDPTCSTDNNSENRSKPTESIDQMRIETTSRYSSSRLRIEAAVVVGDAFRKTYFRPLIKPHRFADAICCDGRRGRPGEISGEVVLISTQWLSADTVWRIVEGLRTTLPRHYRVQQLNDSDGCVLVTCTASDSLAVDNSATTEQDTVAISVHFTHRSCMHLDVYERLKGAPEFRPDGTLSRLTCRQAWFRVKMTKDFRRYIQPNKSAVDVLRLFQCLRSTYSDQFGVYVPCWLIEQLIRQFLLVRPMSSAEWLFFRVVEGLARDKSLITDVLENDMVVANDVCPACTSQHHGNDVSLSTKLEHGAQFAKQLLQVLHFCDIDTVLQRGVDI